MEQIFVKILCKKLRSKPVSYLLTHIFKFLNPIEIEEYGMHVACSIDSLSKWTMIFSLCRPFVRMDITAFF